MTVNSEMSIPEHFRNDLILARFKEARETSKLNHVHAHAIGMGLLAGFLHTGALTYDQYNDAMDFLCNCILNRLSELNELENKNE